MPIPAGQAKAYFTQDLIDVYRQIPEPSSALQTFFPASVKNTRYLTYQVERSGEPVAIDIIRGVDGNMNNFSIQGEKIVDPPYYREELDATQIDLYDRAFGSQLVDKGAMSDFMSNFIVRMKQIQDKIVRAKELQCSQVLQTGVVTVAAGGGAIDFKRKGASIVDLGSGAYWDTNPTTATPYDDIEAGCVFLRTVGKAQGGNFLCIMGQNAWKAFKKTTQFQNIQKFFQVKFDDLHPTLRAATGMAYHGRLDCGSYTVDVATYPEYYDLSGTSTPYIVTTNFIIIPPAPRFKMGHAAVPKLPIGGLDIMSGSMPQTESGTYVMDNYLDPRKVAWIWDIKSCAVALPIAIDTIYTGKGTSA